MSTPLIVASVFAHAEVVAALLEARPLVTPLPPWPRPYSSPLARTLYTQLTTMRQAGALLLPSDEDGTALDNARRNKKGGECVALLEAAMKLRGHLEQVGALATSRYISPYLATSHYISLYLAISHLVQTNSLDGEPDRATAQSI